MKMIRRLKWLFVTNYGRYTLGGILILSGLFSPYGSIPTDYAIFSYTSLAGIIISTAQFIYHVLAAIYLNARKPKKKNDKHHICCISCYL